MELDEKIQMLIKKSFEDKYEVRGVSFHLFPLAQDWSETLPKATDFTERKHCSETVQLSFA